ncbi:MAG: hypothetical protein WA962_06150 [Ornithinimicrobium sp.]
MTSSARSWAGRVLSGGALLLLTACSGSLSASTETTSPPVIEAEQRVELPGSTAAPRDPYVELADTLVDHGVEVWIEVDLVAAWLESPQKYADTLQIAAALSQREGVEGIKIADELGYRDGLETPQRVRQFLLHAGADLQDRAPQAQVLVDVVVPDLGCQAPEAAPEKRKECAVHAGNQDPAASADAVGTYLALEVIDVIDISAGLKDPETYAEWGSSRDLAMLGAWREIGRRGWDDMVTLQARKALAAPGGYAGGERQARMDVGTFIDLPLLKGAGAVDIWAWSQVYQGDTVTLTGPGLAPNALTRELERRHTAEVSLATHMTPSSLQVGVEEDVAAAARMFDIVFVAGGAG